MELGEWIGGRIIENSDNRGLNNGGSTVYVLYKHSDTSAECQGTRRSRF